MEWMLVVLIPAVILAIPIAALVVALSNRNRIAALGMKLESLEEAMTVRRREAAALRKLVIDLEGRPAPEAAPEPEPVEPLSEPEPPRDALPLEVPESPEPAMPAIVEPAEAPAEKPARKWTTAELMAKLPVWVGSVALALAGAFLVKYSVEHGLIGETTRVVLALLFGVALLVAGEWMRSRAAGVAQGLVAAGVAVLYAGLLAGINLYEIIPVVPGFILMVVVTGAAVLLSIRHGKLVAVLGMVGGFMTPQWVGISEPRPAMLFTYLFLLQAGLMAIIRKMRWWPLAVLSVAGGIGWSLLWLSHCISSSGVLSPRPAAYFVLGSVALLVSTAFKAGTDEEGKPRWLPVGLIYGGAVSGMLVLAMTVGIAKFEPVEWGFLWILCGGCLVLGRLDETYSGLPWVASGTGAILLLSWAAGLDPLEITRFTVVAVGLGALFTLGAYAGMWNSRRPDLWAVLSAASALAYTLVGYAGLYEMRPSVPWGLVCILVAALLAAMAWPVLKRRESIAGGDDSLAALAVGVTALASVAVPIELERAWIAVAWAVEIPALAWIANRLRVPVLARLAWGLAGLVAVRLLLNPAVLDYPIGENLVFNWLPYGYGVPIAAFAAGSWLYRRYGDERLTGALEIGSLLLGFWLITLEVRHAFHPAAMDSGSIGMSEWAGYTVAWLLYAVGLLALHSGTGRRLFLVAGTVSGALAGFVSLLNLGLLANPLWIAHPVGETPVFNKLLLAYGLPALLGVALSRMFRRGGRLIHARTATAWSMVMLFLTVTLEIRQAFHGSILRGGGSTGGELYCYSAAWILLAVALLVAAFLTRGTVLRYGSAALMALAVFKVFLVDTANLVGLYRVFSLFGLGVTLLALAYVYQRYVFRPESGEKSGEKAQPPS